MVDFHCHQRCVHRAIKLEFHGSSFLVTPSQHRRDILADTPNTRATSSRGCHEYMLYEETASVEFISLTTHAPRQRASDKSERSPGKHFSSTFRVGDGQTRLNTQRRRRHLSRMSASGDTLNCLGPAAVYSLSLIHISEPTRPY